VSDDIISTWRSFDRPIPPAPGCDPDPVGALEIAKRLGVQDRSVHMMRRRGVLPEPDYDNVNGIRAWEWRTILWWAGETDRLRTPEAMKAYQDMFGEKPPIVNRERVVKGVTTLPDDTPDIPALPSKPKPKPERTFNPRPKAKAKAK
jgi:hypothetical protein